MDVKPYRIVVAANRTIIKRKKPVAVGCAWILHNPVLTDHWAHQGRPAGLGSFAWLATQGKGTIQVTPDGTALPDAISSAIDLAFSDPNATQVQLRTEQDKKLLIFNRHSNKNITVYATGD
jgi:hypothetical protein